ncbi:VOC family protein [Virgibacillus sp. W0430]|uniref:VOC family protein n=1 Tax=Virgibacillus sp. W0430 TaxID=3391580 RepID=UPI003F470E8D
MLALDHIVFGGKNAATSSLEYSKSFSVKAFKGGTHVDWGTYNYLAYFSNNSYLEWLDIYDYDVANQSDNPLIQHLLYQIASNQTGPFQFALRTNNLEKYVNHFIKKGIRYNGPFYGSRTRPNGIKLNWKMLFPAYDYTTEILPFLIEWDRPFNERVDVSVLNAQAIESLSFGAYDKEKFSHIYRLKFKKIYSNTLPLTNAAFHFNTDSRLDYTII